MSTLINDLPKEADAIFQAIKNDPYSKGDADYSVTELISPPRKVLLERQHKDEIVEFASDKIFSLLGQSIHGILERSNITGVAERRLSVNIDGKKISGGMDVYFQDGTLTDYKVTSLYQVKDGGKDEWTQQLNCYSYLLAQNGFAINKLNIVAILRDWSKIKAKREPDSPQKQTVHLDVPVWSQENALAFLRRRIAAHEAAKVDLPLCTKEERWATSDMWAVMKTGRKSAVKLHPTKESAEEHVKVSGAGHYLEARPGESKRCENYCNASNFCQQFKNEQKTKENK